MKIQITIDAEVERVQGKFVSKDDLKEAILAELDEPGSLYVDESEYEVLEWDVS